MVKGSDWRLSMHNFTVVDNTMDILKFKKV